MSIPDDHSVVVTLVTDAKGLHYQWDVDTPKGMASGTCATKPEAFETAQKVLEALR